MNTIEFLKQYIFEAAILLVLFALVLGYGLTTDNTTTPTPGETVDHQKVNTSNQTGSGNVSETNSSIDNKITASNTSTDNTSEPVNES